MNGPISSISLLMLLLCTLLLVQLGNTTKLTPAGTRHLYDFMFPYQWMNTVGIGRQEEITCPPVAECPPVASCNQQIARQAATLTLPTLCAGCTGQLPAPQSTTVCGSGASAFITANPSGSFILASQTPSQTCTYRIIAPASNGWTKVSLSCSFTSGTFARKTLTSPGAGTQTIPEATILTSVGNHAIVNIITGPTAGQYTYTCNWMAVP